MSAAPRGDTSTRTPGVSRGVLEQRTLSRLIGLALAIACAVPLVIGAMLTPKPQGMGTHKALGLPPCGFLVVTGRPCMTCGMTTSVSLATQGRLIDSARVQPAGAILAVVLASGLAAGLHSFAAGTTLKPLLEVATHRRTIIAAALILGGSWGYKVWLEARSEVPSLEAR